MAPGVGADEVLTQAPTFDCPTIGSCYPEPSNGFKVIPLGHMKSADWVNLASVPTPADVCGRPYLQNQVGVIDEVLLPSRDLIHATRP